MREARRKDLRLFLCFHSIQGSFVIGRFVFVPIATQVRPDRVHGLNQRNLLCSSPALQFLLAGDCPRNILMSFEPHESIAVVLCREAVVLFPFVLKDTFEKVPVTPT